ncbi:MAG: bifunctional demethylmenaquinone methyltransferase/2-methoxy-6-polyprenyl-1,4-benzoquinol methylase UbiE [Pirellulaceae bacterium]
MSSANNIEPAKTEPSVDKSGQRVQKMFDEIAPRYDLMNRVLSMNVDVYWRWRTVRIVRPDTFGPILDCCSGTGDLAFAWERATQFSVPVIAADFTPAMLEVGIAKRKRIAKSHVEFVTADTQQLPFEDNQFQVVSAAFGLRNVSDTDQGLREMTRVCRPGGKVAVLEFSMPRRQPIRGFYSWYFKNVLPRVGQAFAKNSSDAYNYLPASVGEFPAYEALTERMLKAGLREAKYYPLTFGIATLYVGVK